MPSHHLYTVQCVQVAVKMEPKLYKTIGLTYSTWRQIEGLRTHPVVTDVLGHAATEAQILELVVKHGRINLERVREQEVTA